MSYSREIARSAAVEPAGAIPGESPLLLTEVCAVYDVAGTFTCELKPINLNAEPKMLGVSDCSSQVVGRFLDALSSDSAQPGYAKKASGGPSRWRAAKKKGGD